MYSAENRFVEVLHSVGGENQYPSEILKPAQEHGDEAVPEQIFGRTLL